MSAAHPSSAAAVSLWSGGVLALAALSLQVVPVLAPAVAASTGAPPAFVGTYMAGLWLAAVVGTAGAPRWIGRHGGWPVSQACLACCAAGLAAVATGHPAGLVLGAVAIGFAQGLEGPTASHLLAAHVPVPRRPLWFSVKQTGVQVGAVAASVTLPLLATLAGWQAAALAAAGLVAASAAALVHARRRYPDQPARRAMAPRAGALSRLRTTPALRWLAATAACFGAIQVCLNGFFVTWGVSERGASLVQAGALLAAAQAGGLVGRLLWGWVGTRSGRTPAVLVGLGMAMSVCTCLLGAFGDDWPVALLAALLVVFGLTASGWNGLLLAEVAGRVPPDEAGDATAAVLILMTLALVTAPLVFSAIATAFGFGAAFMAWTGVGLVGVVAMLRACAAMRR